MMMMMILMMMMIMIFYHTDDDKNHDGDDGNNDEDDGYVNHFKTNECFHFSLEEQRGLIGFLNSWNYGVKFTLLPPASSS